MQREHFGADTGLKTQQIHINSFWLAPQIWGKEFMFPMIFGILTRNKYRTMHSYKRKIIT
jgi:hypothetical protein